MTDTVVAERRGSAPLIPKPTVEHDPGPIPTTTHPHNVFIKSILMLSSHLDPSCRRFRRDFYHWK